MEEDARGIQQTPLFLSRSEENVIILENIGRDAAVDHLSLQLTSGEQAHIGNTDVVGQPGNAVVQQLLSHDRILFYTQLLAQFIQLRQEILQLRADGSTNRVLLLVDVVLRVFRAMKDATSAEAKGYSLFMNKASSSVKWIHA